MAPPATPPRRSARVAAAIARPPPTRTVPAPKRSRAAAGGSVAAPPPWQAAPVVSVGGARAPATLFLGGDGHTLSATPAAAVGVERFGFLPPVERREVFEQISMTAMRRVCVRFGEYWTGAQAAKDGAAESGMRVFRHVGRVTVKGAYIRPKDWEGFAEYGMVRGVGLEKDVVNMDQLFDREGVHTTVKGAEGAGLLSALRVLVDKGSSPFPSQLTVMVCDGRRLKRLLGKKNAGDLEVEVYVGRMLFEIIAFPELITLFKALEVEVEELPKFWEGRADKFGRSPAPEGLSDYSFEALLRRAESTGYREMDDEVDRKVRAGLTVELLPFQRDTVQYMYDRATDTRSLNDYFWQKFLYTPGGGGTELASDVKGKKKKNGHVAAAAGGERQEEGFYFFPLAGEVRLRKPPSIRGAAICEEMGMGKTIECVATVLALQKEHKPFEFDITYADVDRPILPDGAVSGRKQNSTFTDSAKPASGAKEGSVLRFGDVVKGIDPMSDDVPELDATLTVRRWPAKTTLVVLPHSLLDQWRNEVESKAPSLKVHVWKSTRLGNSDESVALGDEACDIVLATYDHLQRDRLLSLIHWQLIVLDEAQVIRRSMTNLAKDCLNMQCDGRFLMTGTPIVGGITDLSGELAFLRVWPFTLQNDGFFERLIESPWRSRSSHHLLDQLVSATMIRHSKFQSNIGLTLPERSYRTLRVEMPAGGSSRAVYSFIRACAEDELERASGELRPSMRALRSLFNLMRLSCVSSELVNTFALDFARRVVWASRMLRAMQQPSDSAGASWTPAEVGQNIKIVSAESALTFVASVGSGGAIGRESRRSFAAGGVHGVASHVHGASSASATDPLSAFKAMSDDELREAVVQKDVLSADAARDTPRERLIGLLGGGIAKLETDSIDEMRGDVLAFHLLSEKDAKTASKDRLLTLLRNHIKLATGIDESGSVHQSGFQTLAKLSETGELPQCPICFDSCMRPCVVACAHFYCHECIVALIISARSGYATQPRCALCRKAFEPHSVVEISKSSIGRNKTKADDDNDDDASIENNEGADGDDDDDADDDDDDDDVIEEISKEVGELLGGESSRATLRSPSRRRSTAVPTPPASPSPSTLPSPSSSDSSSSSVLPQTSAELLWAEYDNFGDAGPAFAGLGFSPGTPSLNTRFLRHLAAAQQEPAKFHALLEFINVQDQTAKFVVVAEAAGTLQACGRWLAERGIQSVGVGMMEARNNRTRLSSDATFEFRTDPAKRVFMLNTASAAGLTLTDASFVIFLEPLIRRADELQAASRVHRIGQTKNVEIVRMVTVNSIEQDLIAARGGQGPSSSMSDCDEGAALSAAPLTQITDGMLLDTFGWERITNGAIRRKTASAPRSQDPGE